MSSWPSFTLCHHFLIWHAAERVYPGKRFTGYAILGDDVVIVDQKVKDVYMEYIDQLGVVASPAKTLSSPVGVAEFAKRFRMNGLRLDVSPVSMKVLSLITDPFVLDGMLTCNRMPNASNYRFII